MTKEALAKPRIAGLGAFFHLKDKLADTLLRLLNEEQSPLLHAGEFSGLSDRS